MRDHEAMGGFFQQGAYVRLNDQGIAQSGWLVGCAVMMGASFAFVTGPQSSNPRAWFPPLFGVPEDVALIADRIFDNLEAPDDYGGFPVQFAEAIPVGADLSNVYAQYWDWRDGREEEWSPEVVRERRDKFLELLRTAPMD